MSGMSGGVPGQSEPSIINPEAPLSPPPPVRRVMAPIKVSTFTKKGKIHVKVDREDVPQPVIYTEGVDGYVYWLAQAREQERMEIESVGAEAAAKAMAEHTKKISERQA